MKHLDLRHYWLRGEVESGTIAVQHCPTCLLTCRRSLYRVNASLPCKNSLVYEYQVREELSHSSSFDFICSQLVSSTQVRSPSSSACSLTERSEHSIDDPAMSSCCCWETWFAEKIAENLNFENYPVQVVFQVRVLSCSFQFVHHRFLRFASATFTDPVLLSSVCDLGKHSCSCSASCLSHLC